MKEAAADASELISLPAAAERLGLHRATLNEMVRDGRLRGRRVGPHWYVTRDDFDRFAASYVRPPNSPRRPPRRAEPSREVMELLADWHEATVSELELVLQMHPGNIRKHLRLAEQLGLAQRDDYGRWRLTAEGARNFLSTVETPSPQRSHPATATHLRDVG